MRCKFGGALTIGLILAVSGAAQDSRTLLTVTAFMDPWRAGAYNDGSDGTAPASFTFAPGFRQYITFSSITGSWDCGAGPEYGPDGAASPACQPYNIDNPIGPFSGYASTDFVGGLVGMFLENNPPVEAPPPMRFYASNSSQGGIKTNFHSLEPENGQVFFIGDGLTGTGTGSTQVFLIPPTATHLYLGYVDSCSNSTPGCYYNNVGQVRAVVLLQRY